MPRPGGRASGTSGTTGTSGTSGKGPRFPSGPRHAAVVEHALDEGQDLLRLAEPEHLLPEPGSLVADDQKVGVRLPLLDVLPQLLKGEVDVLLLAAEEEPAGAGVEAGGVPLEAGRR